MLFEKKVKRVIDVNKIEEDYKDTERVTLEKGDMPAIVIAALLVFVPLLAIFAALVYGFVCLFF